MILRFIRLGIFPFLQIVFFISTVLCVQNNQLFLGIFFTVLAGLAGTWTLFVPIHEMVHAHIFAHGIKKEIAEVFFTVLIGQPYNGYRASHFAHHHYVNTLEDETSTYRLGKAGPVPQSVFIYTLGWPIQFFRSLLTVPKADSYLHRMREQFKLRFLKDLAFLTPALCFLWILGPLVLALYSLMFYIAWAGMALLNFAQHPPVEYGTKLTTSYYGKIYNRLFYGNGLHFEHHHNMQEDPLFTRPLAGARVIKVAPPLAPFVDGSFAHNDNPKF